jgi:hypothetical protein
VNREVSRASQPPRRLSRRRVSRPRDIHGLARAGSTTPINVVTAALAFRQIRDDRQIPGD